MYVYVKICIYMYRTGHKKEYKGRVNNIKERR